MGYAPVARISLAPDPQDSGTTLKVSGDAGNDEGSTGDRFPDGPFTALVWPVQAIPNLGVNAEMPMVTDVDLDTLYLVRGEPGIDIHAGLQIAALQVIPIEQVGGSFVLSTVFDTDNPPYTVFHEDSQGVLAEYAGTDLGGGTASLGLALDVSGYHLFQWEDGDGNRKPEEKYFVPFDSLT